MLIKKIIWFLTDFDWEFCRFQICHGFYYMLSHFTSGCWYVSAYQEMDPLWRGDILRQHFGVPKNCDILIILWPNVTIENWERKRNFMLHSILVWFHVSKHINPCNRFLKYTWLDVHGVWTLQTKTPHKKVFKTI